MHMRILVAFALMATMNLGGCARKLAPALLYNANHKNLRETFLSGVESGGGGGAASLGEPTGWATLAGKFTMDGSLPARVVLDINKDQTVCAPGGRQVFGEEIVIGPDGGIKDVLIYVSSKLPQDDPKWEHESYEAAKFGDVVFDQKGCIFLSHMATMRSTQTLRVKNSDSVPHNTNLASKRGARSDNFMVPVNKEVPYEPGAASKSGPFSVGCNIHPWMKANMMVFDHPYFAVTKEDGTFEIPNIPAGVQLEFRVWQEAAGNLQEVTVNGKAEPWSKGKFKLELSDNDRRELNVVVNSSAFQ